VTAQDEHRLATTAKALPVIGIWNANDPAGSVPSIAAAPTAFNSAVSGMTTLSAQTGAGPQPYALRLAIADQRGDGRPDYGYQARILYADSITPANLSSSGGAVTITGMGFRPGNTVTVNGVAAVVSGWTANTITAVVPSLHAATAITADVTVRDLASGATTTMAGALNYAAPQPALVLLSAPVGQVFTGSAADTPFAVQLLQSDGVTPIPGAAVTLSVTAGQAQLDACGGGACTLTTDAQGRVSTLVTPLAPGGVTLSAASSAGTVTASFTAITRIQTLTALNPNLYIAAGSHVDWEPQVLLSDNAASAVGIPVQWTADSGSISVSPSATFADSSSIAQTLASIGPLGVNTTASVTACAWAAVCTSVAIQSVAPDQWRLKVVSGSGQAVAPGAALVPVVVRVVDPGGHPIAGAPVDVHQVLEPWAPPCPDTGRCPIAPVSSKASVTLVSSVDGTVTVTPLELAGQPVICNIAVATGTQGFISFALQRLP
jgi:hypothetical protein